MLLSLQYLRGAAALLVVYFHAVLQVQTAFNRPDTALPLFGQSGVDLFFVLSGFVMWTSTCAKSTSIGDFYRRRFVRIVPLYWSMTLAAIIVALLAPQLLRSTRLEWDHAIASLLFLPWPNPAFAHDSPELLTPVVIPGWTLNYEMFFYALFGLALLVRVERRFLTISILILSTLALGYLFADRFMPLRFYGSTLLLEFLAGVAIAAFVHGKVDWDGRACILGALLLLLLLCALDWLTLQTDRALQLGLPAAGIVALAALADQSGRTPMSKWWLAAGDASYSIYLTHVFVIAALRVVVNALGITMNLAGEILFVATALVASTIVGRLIYTFYERPLTQRVGQLLLPRRKTAGIAADVA